MNTTRTPHRRIRRRHAIVAAAVLASITLGVGAPAGADGNSDNSLASTEGATPSVPSLPSTTAPQAAPTARTDSGGAALESRYRSLTASLMSNWAKSNGATTDDLIGPDGEALAGVLGTSGSQLRTMGVDTILGDLDSTIADVTFGVGGAGLDFDQLAAALPKTLNTPDGATIAAGVMSARSMAKLDVPQLTSPGLLANSAPVGSIGPDSLAFGLFYNQTLTSLAANSPDVFSSVMGAGGLTDPATATAFSAARNDAVARLSSGFGGDMLNPCMAVMLSSLASGSTSGNPAMTGTSDGCEPCAVAGAYMGGRLGNIIDGETPQRLIIGDDQVVTDYEWWQQGDAARNVYYDTYPGLRELVEGQAADKVDTGTRQQACAESQQGTSNFLSGQAGDILSRLGG